VTTIGAVLPDVGAPDEPGLVLPGPEPGWAAAELGAAALGDARRTRRLVRLAEAAAARPAASLPEACGDAAGAKAAYRLFDLAARAPGVDVPGAIRAAHAAAAGARLAGEPLVLVAQDTTELDYSAQAATAGLGPIGNGGQRGLLLHSALAVTPDGVPRGLLAQQLWARPEAGPGRGRRRQRAAADKESGKWLRALEQARAAAPGGTTLVHVGDREADVYDLFVAAAATPGTALLVRAAWDRRTSGPQGRLRAELAAAPEAERRAVALPRADDRPGRAATLALRFATVALRPPKHRAAEGLPAVAVDAVLVREVDAPAGAEPVEWLLLTTVPVRSAADGWQRVDWYRLRWRVERYHLVLKSGCRVERLQLETAARLAAALALYATVASALLELTYRARAAPDAPAAALLAPDQWAVLWAARHPGAPAPPAPTLRQAVREVAGLGGFLGRRGDGEPGLTTLWRGLRRLHDLLHGYRLARQLLTEDVGNG
jgi:hypothetical protein